MLRLTFQAFIYQTLHLAVLLVPAIILSPRARCRACFRTRLFSSDRSRDFCIFPYHGCSSVTLDCRSELRVRSSVSRRERSSASVLRDLAAAAGSADLFPGLGSVYGSILPGVVLQTTALVNRAGAPAGLGPSVFALAPSYLPDAPFINRTWGTSSFNDFTGGVKWRFTSPTEPGWHRHHCLLYVVCGSCDRRGRI